MDCATSVSGYILGETLSSGCTHTHTHARTHTHSLPPSLSSIVQQLQRELEAVEQKASDAFCKTEKNSREIESVRQTAQSVGGVKGGRSGRGGGWDVGGSSVEERLMRLEQRTEQQERETSTLKVSEHTLSIVTTREGEREGLREGQHVSGEVV